jgi:hypothetical protein
LAYGYINVQCISFNNKVARKKYEAGLPKKKGRIPEMENTVWTPTAARPPATARFPATAKTFQQN